MSSLQRFRQAEERQELGSSTSPDMEDDLQPVSEDSTTDQRNRNAHAFGRFPLRSDENDLSYDDRYHVDLVIQLILNHIPSMSHGEMRSAAAVLLALERLPYATPGVDVRFSFSTPNLDGNYAWADIEILEEAFRLSLGEYFYTPGVGGDTESRTVFFAQAGSDWREGDINEWLSSAQYCGPPRADEGEDNSDYEVIDQFLDGKFAEFVKCVEDGSDYRTLNWFSDLMTDDRGDEDRDS